MTHGDLKVSARPRFGPQIESGDPAGVTPPRGIDLADEPLGGSDSEEFELAGAGGQASTSSSTFQVVAEYEVPRDERALLVEMSASTESNGQVRLAANGVTFGPFSGAVDVSIPGDRGHLYTRRVVVEHKSTDGASVQTQATIIAQEV